MDKHHSLTDAVHPCTTQPKDFWRPWDSLIKRLGVLEGYLSVSFLLLLL